MTTLTTHRPKHHSNGIVHRKLKKSAVALRSLRPLKRNITNYVYKKPYQSLGILTLLTGAVIGFVYAKLKYFK